MDPHDWLQLVAGALGTDVPTQAQVDDLLSLAGTAAHASERWAAPVTCAMVAAAGLDPAEARALVERLASGAAGTPGATAEGDA